MTTEPAITSRGRSPAQDAASILAEAWDQSLPIDPVRIARKLGIDVVNAHLDPSTSGALIKERQRIPTIVLNATDSPNRKRFTCAHEIGHWVRHSADPDEYEYVDRRDALASTGRDPEEIYANQFAAALLMPADRVRQLADEGLSDLQMALRFDVSLEAMQYRLQNLGLR